MSLLNRAKRILKSQINSALDDLESRVRSDFVDPLSEGAATMDDEEWFRAAKAREAREQQRRRGAQAPPRAAAALSELDRAYANLDCPAGSSLKVVRAAWKAKMKKYHPDNFHAEPKKRDAATRLTALLNESFQKIESHLKAGGDKG